MKASGYSGTKIGCFTVELKHEQEPIEQQDTTKEATSKTSKTSKNRKKRKTNQPPPLQMVKVTSHSDQLPRGWRCISFVFRLDNKLKREALRVRKASRNTDGESSQPEDVLDRAYAHLIHLIHVPV